MNVRYHFFRSRARRLMSLTLIMSLLLCSVLSGCGGTAGEAAPTDADNMEEPMVETVPNPDDLVISTPVGDLRYPAEWADHIRLEDVSTDALFGVTLYGKVDQQEALLFTIYMGTAEKGYYFGAAPNAQGEPLEIYIDIEDFVFDGTWSEEATDAVYAMQSRVNDIIGQFHELPGFVAG